LGVSLRSAAIASRAEEGVMVVSTTTTSSSLTMKTLFALNIRPGGSVRTAA
jgi:hypothetical protein